MATALKSASVTAADNIVSGLASVMNDKELVGGVLHSIVETIEISTSEVSGSVVRMCRVHSSWHIAKISLANDVIATFVPHIGLYYTAQDGGAVLDADAYLSSHASGTGTAGFSLNQRSESLSNAGDIANIKNKVWQDALLTADPSKWFDVAFTSTGTPGGAGTYCLRVLYTDGN